MKNRVSPKQNARLGMFYLEEAVLDVLLEAKYEDKCIGPAEISKRGGIFRDGGRENTLHDAIAFGILVKLHSEKRVQRCTQPNGKGGWKLTDKEFHERREDTVE